MVKGGWTIHRERNVGTTHILLLILYFSQESDWISSNDSVIGNILGHNRSCSDY